MMTVRSVIALVITFSIGLLYAFIKVLPVIVYGLITQPGPLFSRKKRLHPPACLNDPALGTHGFARVSVNGQSLRIHYVANGQEGKPLIVCLHGYPEFWFSFRHQLREFGDDYRIIAVDLRGFCESDKPPSTEDYCLGNCVEDVKELVSALGYSSCILMGHSWGGAIGWGMTVKYPEIVSKLILMNGPYGNAVRTYLKKDKSQWLKFGYNFFFQLPWLPELFMSMDDFGMVSAALCGTPEYLGTLSPGAVTGITAEEVEAYKYAFSQPGALKAAMDYYRALMRYRTSKSMIATIDNTPVLMVWGAQDKILPVGMAELLPNIAKNSQLEIIQDGGHFIQQDKPDVVNAKIREFLKGKKKE